MRFAYFDKLSRDRQRIYLKSDAIESLGLPPGLSLGGIVARIAAGLVADDRGAIQSACQALINALARGYHVPPVRVRVLARRPADGYGELHGLYEPEDEGVGPRITVWMRTAQKKQVVAFKTFLRTLVHELCHHLDYELFALEETFHTEGFYKRESTLAAALLEQLAAEGNLRER
ncbi:MAG TPA: hypothetical protein VJQ49_06005 [Casimicrobiaceae bacterium]|nr:hypothetical protein [Casimicrobiaceae bacterium]